MAGTTLRSSKTQVNLAAFGTGNPFRVGVGVSIVDGTPGGEGILGNASRAWTLSNAGSVVGGVGARNDANPGGFGVDLLGHASHLANSGTIAGGAGTANNTKLGIGRAGGDGVLMSTTSVLSNSGTIVGGAGADDNARSGTGGAGGYGVVMSNFATLTNSGTIAGGDGGGDPSTGLGQGGRGGDGISLSHGHLINGAKGLIEGGTGGASLDGGDGGAAVRLVNGVGIATNDGTIQGGAGFDASPYLTATTLAGAGGVGFYMDGTTNSLSNHGTIDGGAGGYSIDQGGNGGIGVDIIGSASIANLGMIYGGAGGYGGHEGDEDEAGNGGVGVELSRAGTITNHSGGTITGGNGGNGTFAESKGGGRGGFGVSLSAGGTIENQSGATIRGGEGGYYNNSSTGSRTEAGGGVGVSFGGVADSTLINAGTIAGGSGAMAVQFGAGNDLLVLDPGAAFTGGVDGGTGKNTLELAAGHRVGTIIGIGTNFTRFQTIKVDAGASWVGTKQDISGEALSVDGVLTLKGACALDGAVNGTGTIKIAAWSALATEGTVASTDKIQFNTKTGLLSIQDTAGFNAGIGGLVAGDKIDLRNADFAFSPSETLAFTENAGKTAGTLTVKNGANIQKLLLFGQFVASGFDLAADGHGGSMISYTPAVTASPVELASHGHSG
jgi:hypothetical protein